MAEERTPQEMAKALYSFKGSNPKTLSFDEGEYFLIYHPSTKNKNWWQVINHKAQTGYVPSNYVTAELVTGEFMANWLDKTIAILESSLQRPLECEELLVRLKKRRCRLDEQTGSCEISRAPSLASIPPAPQDTSPCLVKGKEKVQISTTTSADSPMPVNIEKPKIRPSSEDSRIKKRSAEECTKQEFSNHSQSFKEPNKISDDSDWSGGTYSVKKRVAELGGTLKFKKTQPVHLESETVSKPSTTETNNVILNWAPERQLITSVDIVRMPSALKAEPTQLPCGKQSSSTDESKEDKSSRGTASPPVAHSSDISPSSKRKAPQATIAALQEMRRRSSVGVFEAVPLNRRPSVNGTAFEAKEVSEDAVYQIVEEVRKHTGLSYDGCRTAVNVVLAELDMYLPNSAVLESILKYLEGPLKVPPSLLEDTYDAKRLRVIFTELVSCKEDSQQRSWMVHEDEKVILEYVEELTSILASADPNVAKYVISRNYSGVQSLTDYYQMEVRWQIRQKLLSAYSVLCGLDRDVVTLMLTSVLPCELSRDMIANPTDTHRLCCSALMLTVIFSMGDTMPYTHQEYIGENFFNFIFSCIEQPPDGDDMIPDLFTSLILSINLQFKFGQDNAIVKTLGKREWAKEFTERILVLFNREEDPVRIVFHEPDPPHSVLKLFIDLFGNTSTANLFYTNDVKVLIDIVVRQLTDLSPGDERRLQYLNLCRVILRTPSFSEYQHRREDLFKTFTRILLEELDESAGDQKLVKEIFNEFPQYLMT